MVGAKGFEPSTSWSRNSVPKILKALSGVAYETERADFPLSVVPNLYLVGWDEPLSWHNSLGTLVVSIQSSFQKYLTLFTDYKLLFVFNTQYISCFIIIENRLYSNIWRVT
jgi:hypothetical protein